MYFHLHIIFYVNFQGMDFMYGINVPLQVESIPILYGSEGAIKIINI